MATKDASNNTTYAYVDRVAKAGNAKWQKDNEATTYTEEIGNSHSMLWIVYRHAGTGGSGKRKYSWPTRVMLKIQAGSFVRTKGYTLTGDNVGKLAEVLAKPGVAALVAAIDQYNADHYDMVAVDETEPVKDGFNL